MVSYGLGIRRRFATSACLTVLSLAVSLALSGRLQAQPAQRQGPLQVWFSPRQDYYNSATRTLSWTHYDFLAMFEPNAHWQRALAQIDAIMFDTSHAAEGFSRNGVPSLPKIRAMLARHELKVGGGGSVLYTDGLCSGTAVEGMTGDKGYAREAVLTTRTWHDAGMPMTYFVMDSPFYFGYDYKHDKCHFSIEDVARRTATTMRMIRAYYPKIIIVDAEGPGEQLPAQWLPDYHRFLSAFRAEYGAPIDYLDMDLHWTDTWHTGYRWVTAAKEITDDIHRQGLRVSLIVNAEDLNWDPDVPPPRANASPKIAMTADYWIAAVRKHIDLIKRNAIQLDAVDLASWMKFPRQNLPETDPLAWTAVVNYAHEVLAPSK
ncbi:hypothetical protein [Rhodopila sp.]|uniref:hypothetical protein n=1 Tax=Rhodopila sp. TaxID=2480087 RepID=UPI003D0E9DB8